MIFHVFLTVTKDDLLQKNIVQKIKCNLQVKYCQA